MEKDPVTAWWRYSGDLKVVACEQAPGWVSGEIAECSLGRAGRAESGLVRREEGVCASLADSHFTRRIFSALAGSLFAGYEGSGGAVGRPRKTWRRTVE